MIFPNYLSFTCHDCNRIPWSSHVYTAIQICEKSRWRSKYFFATVKSPQIITLVCLFVYILFCYGTITIYHYRGNSLLNHAYNCLYYGYIWYHMTSIFKVWPRLSISCLILWKFLLMIIPHMYFWRVICKYYLATHTIRTICYRPRLCFMHDQLKIK